MTLNLNCCPNFNLGLGNLCSCKGKPETESPPPSPTDPSVPDEGEVLRPGLPARARTRGGTLIDVLGEPITLIETEQIHFESLLPNHSEYLYLKILKNRSILFADGGLIDDLHMTLDDLIGIDLCSVVKNPELFGGCICPLITKTLEQGTAYQFCFKVGAHERLICCSIYPCSIPGHISSADCVIRPVINGFRPSLIDKFVLPLDDTKSLPIGDRKTSGWKSNLV